MDDTSTWVAIFIVSAITFASRIAGPILLSRIKVTPLIERFLDGLTLSVIVALVASILAQNGTREAIAVGFAVFVMLATRSAIWAMTAGMLLAAGLTALT